MISFSKLLNLNKVEEEEEFILKIRQYGDTNFFEVELPKTEKNVNGLLKVICEEFDLSSVDDILVMKKLPDILIRKDNDVKRLKLNQEIEFYTKENVNILT